MANSGIYEDEFDLDPGSDHESPYDADSPSDGYFTNREHPQETFVENSSVQAESEAKAREAAEESQASSAAATRSTRTSPTASPVSASRTPVWADESAPILDAGPPPPDYAAATAHRPPTASTREVAQPRSSSPNSIPSYGSITPPGQSVNMPPAESAQAQWPFGQNGNPFTHPNFPFGAMGGPFGVNRAPQHMRDGSDGDSSTDEESGLMGRRRSKPGKSRRYGKPGKGGRGRDRRRWRCKPMAFVNVCLAIVVVALICFVGYTTRDSSHGADSHHPNTPTSPTTPTIPTTPQPSDLPDSGGGSHKEDPDLPHDNYTIPAAPSTARCPYAFHTPAYAIDFPSLKSFTLTELTDVPAFFMSWFEVYGTVMVQPAPGEQTEDIRIWIRYATTAPFEIETLSYAKEKEALHLQFPHMRKMYDISSHESGCMDMQLLVNVKKGVELKKWELTTTNLNVEVAAGLFGDAEGADIAPEMPAHLSITETATITTFGNHIRMGYWSARDTLIETTSGAVRGTFALRDSLIVRSRSGSVNIRVEPKEIDKDHPAPAIFSSTTESGQTHVNFPDRDLPKRDYRTSVTTRSATVSGYYILGSEASFHTTSGSLSVTVLPYSSTMPEEHALYTASESGSTSLTLLEPYSTPNDAISHLLSVHKASSGSLHLIYPGQWEGTIDAAATSGSILVGGKGVEVIAQPNTPLSKRFIGHKGFGDGKMRMSTKSGSINVQIGEY